jgi:hypothetical protein
MDCFVAELLAMTSEYTSAISPRRAREFCRKRPALESEGAGNAGRWMRPQPCVRNKKAHKHSHHGHTGTPGIPRAMVLTVSFALLCPENLPECANGRFSPTARRWI